MTEQTQLAWNIIETTNTNLFLTGKAGTGKTTFLRRLKEESSKRIVVVAPTGIAAINAEGVTIHSFFQLSFAPFIPNYNLKERCRRQRAAPFPQEQPAVWRCSDGYDWRLGSACSGG